MKVNKTWGFSVIILVMTMFVAMPVYAVSPTEALAKAKAKIMGAKSLSADFTMSVGGNAIKGQILSKGKKFAITSNSTSSWYNGTDLYTYNPSAGETTVFKPTASELVEVNPLLYINSASDFKATASKQKKAGTETVILLPVKKNSGIRSVTLELDAKTFLPRSIKIATSSGTTSTISVSGIKLNTSLADSQFEYPKVKYKNAKIIDMR